MKNPFKSKLSAEQMAVWMNWPESEYAAHAINKHERMKELLQLAYDVIEDDLEERPARHSLGHLAARIRVLLAEEAKHDESV